MKPFLRVHWFCEFAIFFFVKMKINENNNILENGYKKSARSHIINLLLVLDKSKAWKTPGFYKVCLFWVIGTSTL